MEYLLLTVTVACGVIGNIAIKLSRGFTRPAPTALVFGFYGLTTYLLTLTVQYFEVGVVYAIWSGAGIAIVALVGMVFFGESRARSKLLSIALIILGVVLLHGASIDL